MVLCTPLELNVLSGKECLSKALSSNYLFAARTKCSVGINTRVSLFLFLLASSCQFKSCSHLFANAEMPLSYRTHVRCVRLQPNVFYLTRCDAHCLNSPAAAQHTGIFFSSSCVTLVHSRVCENSRRLDESVKHGNICRKV